MVRLEDGSRVAVVGGGPAGSFFALSLLRFGRERGIRPRITVYQDRDFDELGTKGCKGCAGILSTAMLGNLRELDLRVPEEIVQTSIDHYTVHSPFTSISIRNPEEGRDIVSVYRGGGPRLSHYDARISLDGWLLRQAQAQGANVEHQRVARISLGDGAAVEAAGRTMEYDLIVLACGAARPVPVEGVDYLPPATRTMAQDELHAGSDVVRARLGTSAHVFLFPYSEIVFGTLVPKGPFINVSVLSSGDRPVSVESFLSHEIVRAVLPADYERSCGCRPKAVTGYARRYFGDRFVAVGDAAVARLFKDGVGSALLTARQAAWTAVHHGVAREDFERYYRPLCQGINRDNSYGRLLFALHKRAKNSRSVLLAQHRLVADEQTNLRGPQPFTRSAWGLFTGSYSYRAIARMSLNPVSLAKLSLVFVRDGWRNHRGRDGNHRRTLYVGSRKVLILGSGFGGTYVLRHLVPSLNKAEDVETTMVSNENFFLFSPLLHEVAMGGVETRHIAYPIRRLQWRDRFNFVQAKVERIDLEQRRVTTGAGTFPFDYLVMALGSVPVMPKLDGSQPRIVFTLKTLHDSMMIRNHVISVFEQASREPPTSARRRQLLTFVVSGAGYTGVQVVAELSDFVNRTLLKFYKAISQDSVRIVLVESEAKIIADLHTKLGAYTMRHLKTARIEVRLRSHVSHVSETGVEINGEEIVPTDTLIWVAGIVANPVIADLNVPRDSLGRVAVDEYLELPGFPGVYAIGDCAYFRDEVTGRAAPPRAHVAVRQAKTAAKNILAELRGYDKKPYRYSQNSEIVSLGASRAVFRFGNLRVYGFPAKLIWLAAYSFLVTGAYNRLRILNDWALTRMFGRDTTFLDLTK